MKIDRNVPLPPKSPDRKRGYTTAKRGQSKYEFGEMQVGHSFIVEPDKRTSVATLAKKFGDQQTPKPWRFIVRYDEKGVLRCWRTE